jgi:hypothetical protein
MSDSGIPPTVTRVELLDFRERHWRRRLDMGSIAAEALDHVAKPHREQALEVLGHLYQQQPDPFHRSLVLRRWPSVHVVATSGVAADHYESGTFWPKLISLLGVQGAQGFHREWGEAFLTNLQRLGLPTFDGADDDAGSKYVGRILMHSGMPTYCLRDFYRVIGERRAKVTGLEPEEFVSWASSRARQKQLYNVDRPVDRFLQYGGDFAVDVTGRAFDLLDAVAAGGDGSDVPLPERFRDVAIQLRADGGVLSVQRRISWPGATADQHPRLIVDPFGQGLILRLPAVGDAPDGSAVWLVGLDGMTQRVATRALFPGLNEPAPQTDVPIVGPVRTASAALLGREHLQAVMTVVDDKDPLLAFGEDGVLLPAGLPLTGRPTWLLFPGEPDDLQLAGEGRLLSESPLPPGWSGWCLALIDLDDVSSLFVGATGRLREVRNQASARVVADEPVRGVRTSSGLPVVSGIPTIQLPAQLGEADWDVTLLDASGDVIGRWKNDGHDSDPNSIWDAVPRPAVGTFTIRVRGPWGRGATRALTVIEGLDIAFNPPWRRFVEGGLQPCVARVNVLEGMQTSRPTIEFPEADRESYVSCGAHNDFRTLVVTPPHMTIAYQSAEATTSPSVRPLRLFREDVTDDPGTLILDVGTAADPKLHFLASQHTVQVIEATAGRSGIYRFGLSKLVDTLSSYPQGQLALESGGGLVVATIRPRRLISDVMLADEALEFSDCVEIDGLTALVYSTRAPWRDPAYLPVAAGRAVLPPWLVNAGPIRVLVRLEDPWAPLPVPEWPAAGKSRLVEAEGYPVHDDPEATAVSAFLAGEGDVPAGASDLARLWSVRGLLGGLALGDRVREVAAAVDAAVHAQPRAALLSLTASRAPSASIPALLIRAGLAWANLEEAHDDTPPSWTPRNALPSALLSAADAYWSQDEVAAAMEVCGDVVADLLSGTDPFANAGHLDASAEVFDSQAAMREEFVRQTALVPTGLLTGDSRVIAAMEFVKQRREPRLEWLIKNAHKVVDETERMLRILDDPVGQAAFNARRHLAATGGWRVVPAVSLGLALAARHAARGNATAAGWLPRQSRIWADLATVAPQMVTIDLIVAELLVASSVAKTQEQDT